MKVLVTGGAGYIGSHTVKELIRRGHSVVILDDLRTGHRSAVRGQPLVVARIQDRGRVEQVLAEHRVDAVLHFAASCYVGESVDKPAEYYENNVVGTFRLAEACVAVGVEVFVLSSSAATYGQPDVSPIPEDSPQRPVNPYGRTKFIGEQILADLAHVARFRPVFLRYFNAAGCDPEGELGEHHDPETHLIPNALLAAAGKKPSLQIYGTDYPTPDGTCVRDFVHVTDLADAHVRALEFAANGGSCRAFNLGNGSGFSVQQVADRAREVTGVPFRVDRLPRRPGDPATLVASSARAKSELGWSPRYADLGVILKTAWSWLVAHPNGYPD